MKQVSSQFEFLEIPRVILSVTKNGISRGKIGRGRRMKGYIAIDGRDHAFVDQIVASV